MNNTFRAVDFDDFSALSDNFDTLNKNALLDSDKAEIAGWGMPSGSYVNLTLGESGASYSAPANGWVQLTKVSGVAKAYIVIYGGGISIGQEATSNVTGLQIYKPVKKGETFYVNYSATGETTTFKFVYAQGAR